MPKIARNKDGRKEIYLARALVYREVGRLMLLSISDDIFEMAVNALLNGENGTFMERHKSDERVKEILERLEGVDRLKLPETKAESPKEKKKRIEARVDEAIKNSKVKGKKSA